MSQIVPKANGEFIQPEAAPGVEPVEADDLPQVKPDPYADVSHTDFSDVESLSRVQQLQLAQIAASRGDNAASMAWKQVAQQGVLNDERAADAARMEQILNPNVYAGELGPIIEQRSDTPWHNSADWQQTRADLDAAMRQLDEMAPNERDYHTVSVNVVNLTTKLAENQAAATQAALDAGTMSESDLRILATTESLRSKSELVAKQMAGQ